MDPRDVIVDCHCMRCTAGFLPPARIRAITQQKHLARDQSDAELAYSLGQPPTTTLLAAIQKNQTVAASPPSSPSPAAAAASSPVASAFDTNDDTLIFDDHGLDEFQLPDQTSSSPHHISQSSAEEEEQEDFGREVDAESDHEDDGLSSVDELEDEDDLFGISDGEDGIHVAIWDEDAENDGNSQRSADEEREGDPRAISRHGQDLLEQLLDGYDPGSRPRRPPNRHSSAHRVRERMTRSQLASLRHVVTCRDMLPFKLLKSIALAYVLLLNKSPVQQW
ncbi:unnamed protein product [Tilletia laevis]|uniref:Uncharacterized protein n=2 Tax=Tilletia TaxID=13289 RepID=A0A177ULH9_9BASI|nr:hypothetical protein CF335_g6468 [Tilletia laevis]KAE8257913.1 hypothetical protein A4X03_0g4530 [Tilletia caries]CAD6889497.1 unnamed protein product [Tilletia caries]CAD6920375.1 unnamed protein product [Tilletia caries]CAD6937590.1 unnamed protein product [Tilletia laevis]